MVGVGSKGGLTVPGTMRDVTVAVWDVTASILAVTASIWAVISFMSTVMAFMYDVQMTCRMLHPLRGLLQAPCELLQPLCIM